MTDGEWDVDQWVRWEQGICYRYSPGDLVMLVVALEQIRVVDKTGWLRSLSWGVRADWYWKLRRELISTLKEGLYLYGRTGIHVSVFVEKSQLMEYVGTGTGVYINTYDGRMTGRVW